MVPKVTRDQELWAMALDIERRHGPDAERVIASEIGRSAVAGEPGGVALWRAVARRFAQLKRDGEAPS